MNQWNQVNHVVSKVNWNQKMSSSSTKACAEGSAIVARPRKTRGWREEVPRDLESRRSLKVFVTSKRAPNNPKSCLGERELCLTTVHIYIYMYFFKNYVHVFFYRSSKPASSRSTWWPSSKLPLMEKAPVFGISILKQTGRNPRLKGEADLCERTSMTHNRILKLGQCPLSTVSFNVVAPVVLWDILDHLMISIPFFVNSTHASTTRLELRSAGPKRYSRTCGESSPSQGCISMSGSQ